MQTRWAHIQCALRGAYSWASRSHDKVERLSQLAGWDRMGYDANLEIREGTGEALDGAAEAVLKATMERLEGLQDALCHQLSVPQMIATLDRNGIDPRSLGVGSDSIAMSVLIADGLAHGLAQDCPACGNPGLVQCAGRVTCWGYVGGYSVKCQYKCREEHCKRYKFRMCAEVEKAPWLLELKKAGKAANAGGVATSGLEMSQNATHMRWTRERSTGDCSRS